MVKKLSQGKSHAYKVVTTSVHWCVRTVGKCQEVRLGRSPGVCVNKC